MPTLKPVGHQSTNWMVRLVLMVAMAALTSLGTTSPQYNRQKAMYLPWRGSHFTIWLAGSKQALVISATERKLFMVGFLSRDDRGVCGQREVDTGIGHQVGLELCKIHIQGTIKPQESSDGGHNLTYQLIQVGICWALNVEISRTDVIDGLIVYHEGAIRALQGGVGGEDGV